MIENLKLIELSDKIALNFKPEKIFLSEGNPNSESDLDLLIIQVSKSPSYKRVLEIRKLLILSKLQMDLIVISPDIIEDEQELKSSSIHETLKTSKLLYECI